MRLLPEWRGTTDDQAIPARVKDRIARKAGDKCQHCGRKIDGKLRAEFDHVIPLCLGGAHRESNIALVCHEYHRAKTKLDVKMKAKVARWRKHALGIRPKSRFACSRDSKWKKRLDGSVVLRESR